MSPFHPFTQSPTSIIFLRTPHRADPRRKLSPRTCNTTTKRCGVISLQLPASWPSPPPPSSPLRSHLPRPRASTALGPLTAVTSPSRSSRSSKSCRVSWISLIAWARRGYRGRFGARVGVRISRGLSWWRRLIRGR